MERNLPPGVGPLILLLLLLSLHRFTTLGVDSDPDRRPCRGGCPAATRVALQPAPDSPLHLLIEVELAGRPGLFLLDTGSELTYLDQEAAREHELLASSRPILGAVNDHFGIQRVVDAEAFAVGRFAFDDFELEIIDLGAVREGLGAPVAGVLGMNVIGLQTFVIDFARRALVLDSGAGPPARWIGADACPHAVPAHWVGRGLYVPVEADGRAGRALVDSGAWPSEIDRELAAGLPTGAPQRVTSYSAKHQEVDTVVRTVVPELRVGALEATHVPMLVTNETVLGADFFHDLVLGVPLGAGDVVIGSPRPAEGGCTAPARGGASSVAGGP